MHWILFDESDHRAPAPGFCLPTVKGSQVCLQDFHEDCSLVLFIARDNDCPGCRELLQEFALRQQDYQAQDAKIIAILPEQPNILAQQPDIAKLPFPVLADGKVNVRDAYASLMREGMVGPQDSMIFILDCYSAPWAALIGSDLKKVQNGDHFDENIQEDILKWLEYIGIQCPE